MENKTFRLEENYLNVTSVQPKNGVTKYEIIREVDSYYVLLFNVNGLKVTLVDYQTLIKMVQDEDTEFYYNEHDDQLVEALEKLNFNYEDEDYIYEFSLENGEIIEKDELD